MGFGHCLYANKRGFVPIKIKQNNISWVLLNKCKTFTMIRGNFYSYGDDNALHRCVIDYDVIIVTEITHYRGGG